MQVKKKIVQVLTEIKLYKQGSTPCLFKTSKTECPQVNDRDNNVNLLISCVD